VRTFFYALFGIAVAFGIASTASASENVPLPKTRPVSAIPAEQAGIVSLFFKNLPSCTREVQTGEEGTEYEYRMITLTCKSFSAILFTNAKVKQISVAVVVNGDTYYVIDNDGDGQIEEANNGHELLDIDDAFKAKLSAKYRKKIAEIERFAKHA
jgi:hypothetical protein